MEPREEEQKQSAEVDAQRENPYAEAAAFIKDSRDHFNDKQLPLVIDENLLDVIVKQAEAGEVTTHQMNEAGEKQLVALTPKELIFGQFNEFIRLHDAKKLDEAFNHIPRIHGLRETMRTVAGDQKLAEALKLAIMHRQAAMTRAEQNDDGSVPIKPGTMAEIMGTQPDAPEILSDQEREEVVEELGEQATETVVEDPAEAVIAARRLVESDGLSDSAPSSAGEVETVSESARLEEQLRELAAAAPTDQDRVALHQFATAINYNESNRARARMTYGVEQSGLPKKYKELYDKLKAAQKAEGKI